MTFQNYNCPCTHPSARDGSCTNPYRDVLEGLAMYLGVGSGDEETTAEEYGKRIRLGILMHSQSSMELGRRLAIQEAKGNSNNDR